MEHDIGDHLGQALAMARTLGDAARANEVSGGHMGAATVGWYSATLKRCYSGHTMRTRCGNEARVALTSFCMRIEGGSETRQ